MSDEALLREKTATMSRMLGLQGTIGMFGHVSIRVPGTNRVHFEARMRRALAPIRPAGGAAGGGCEPCDRGAPRRHDRA